MFRARFVLFVLASAVLGCGVGGPLGSSSGSESVDGDPVLFFCHPDADGDSYGNDALRFQYDRRDVRSCEEAGMIERGRDCDDADPSMHPGAYDDPCDWIDADCDGIFEQQADADGDGFGECIDCDDEDPTRVPRTEELCDGLGVDNDCNESTDDDGDLDGDGVTLCDGDCDDLDADRFPGNPEVCGNWLDEDCSGEADDATEDDDGDGFARCDDCDEGDPTIFPGATEVCDAVDDDCNGLIEDGDVDWDGFTVPCGADGLDGTGDEDCAPQNHLVHPVNDEICNGIDDDCDPATDELGDVDGDGSSICAGDCDDADPSSYPGGSEVCDGADNDCVAGADDPFDVDGDGVSSCGPDGVVGTADDDCDDSDPARRPGSVDPDGDGLDADCDGDDGAVGCTGGPVSSTETDPVVALEWALEAMMTTPGTVRDHIEGRLAGCSPTPLPPSSDPLGVPTPIWPNAPVTSWSVDGLEHSGGCGAVGVLHTGHAAYAWTPWPWHPDYTINRWIDADVYSSTPGGDALGVAGVATHESGGYGNNYGSSSWSSDLFLQECTATPPSWLRRGTTTRSTDGTYSWVRNTSTVATQTGTVVAYADTTPWVAEFDLSWSVPGAFLFWTEPLAGSWIEVSLLPTPGAPPTATARLEFDCLGTTCTQFSDGCGELYVDGVATGCWCPPVSVDCCPL